MYHGGVKIDLDQELIQPSLGEKKFLGDWEKGRTGSILGFLFGTSNIKQLRFGMGFGFGLAMI